MVIEPWVIALWVCMGISAFLAYKLVKFLSPVSNGVRYIHGGIVMIVTLIFTFGLLYLANLIFELD